LTEYLIAFSAAALLTLFDLDQTFYVPKKVPGKVALYSWWFAFIVANGLLAAGAYHLFGDVDGLKNINSWLRALLVGISYLAFVRLKITTFKFQGQEVPAGVELLYVGAKNFVYKRINRIAKEARSAETIERANNTSLADLGSQARLAVNQDAILTAEEKKANLTWILSVLQDAATSDFDKKAALADYILSGQRSTN